MIPVVREDDLHFLSLPEKACTRLNQNGLYTVGQLLDDSDPLHGLPDTLAEEVDEVLQQVLTGEFFVLADLTIMRDFWAEGIPDAPIGQLHLSPKAVHCLEKMDIHCISAMSNLTADILTDCPGMGPRIAREILDRYQDYWRSDARALADQVMAREDPGWLKGAAQALSDLTALPVREAAREISAALIDLPETPDPSCYRLLYQREPLRRAIVHGFLFLLRSRPEGISREELLALLPEGTAPEDLDELLREMEFHMQVWLWDDLVQYRLPTVMDFAAGIRSVNGRILMQHRLKGMTLEDAGWRLGFSRQRASELAHKSLARRPVLREDRYQPFFNRYAFNREDFMLCFDEPQETFYYLEMLRPRGTKLLPLRSMLEDETVPVVYRRRAERAVYRNYVTIDGVRIEKTRPALARHCVQRTCREPTTMSIFLVAYRQMLKEHGLEDIPRLAIETRSYENKFNSCSYCLWSQNHRFRYYPTDERDFTELLEALDLGRFHDVEISSLKIFRENLRLMEEYDIRDEYELHNLLKKVWPKDSTVDITFKKMPTIIFGTPDRNRQVTDLMMQHAPISASSLAALYEEIYGAKRSTVQANYFDCIELYLDNRVYRVDRPPLPDDQMEKMRSCLTDDFYRTTEVWSIYHDCYPDASPYNMNAITLRKLGFHVYSDYILRNGYGSAADYFRQQLTASDIVDMRANVRRYAGIVSYTAEVYNLKARREIVEYLPYRYISRRRLLRQGISTRMMEDYCQKVADFMEPGTFFTVHSLRAAGFHHPLDEHSYDEWFFSSVLQEDREDFTTQRMAREKVFFRGRQEFRLSDFYYYLVVKAQSIRVEEMRDLLRDTYGIFTHPNRILSALEGTNVYYEPVLKVLYPDFRTYARKNLGET